MDIQVYKRLIVIGAVVIRFALLVTMRFLERPFTRHPQTARAILGRELAKTFELLGSTFLKAGQMLSSRPDLLSLDVTQPLSRLCDQLPAVEGRTITRIVERSLGRSLSEAFTSFDMNPVACASIAQVHRARLLNGHEVAVKVRKPGVMEMIEADLKIANCCARLLASLPGTGTLPLVALVKEISEPIRSQTNFLLEAENNRRLRRNFFNKERVSIPALVDALCTESVLIMDLYSDLKRVDSQLLSLEDRRIAAMTGLNALYKMIFLDGFVHADMHAGNVFLRTWGEFVMLDTGLVAALDDNDRIAFADFFFGIINNEGAECARIIYETALSCSPKCKRSAFEAAMIELVSHHSSLRSKDFEVTRFVYQLMDLQRSFGICGSTKFIMVVLAIAVFDGICKQLYPECDFQAAARPFLTHARYRRKDLKAGNPSITN